MCYNNPEYASCSQWSSFSEKENESVERWFCVCDCGPRNLTVRHWDILGKKSEYVFMVLTFAGLAPIHVAISIDR